MPEPEQDPDSRPISPDEFARRAGLDFADPELLLRALTHPSWVAEQGGQDYERLEFLGDSVLGLLVAEHVHAMFPERPEGDLTSMKNSVVHGGALAEAAREIGLGHALRLGRGSERSGDRSLPSVLEDAFEALVGAVYLDRGIDAARTLVTTSLMRRLDPESLMRGIADPKTKLQEMTQERGLGLPEYRLVSREGPDHRPRFTVEVLVGGESLGRATGHSKQAAEQLAAAETILALGSRD